jgi:hypothetical protein
MARSMAWADRQEAEQVPHWMQRLRSSPAGVRRSMKVGSRFTVVRLITSEVVKACLLAVSNTLGRQRTVFTNCAPFYYTRRALSRTRWHLEVPISIKRPGNPVFPGLHSSTECTLQVERIWKELDAFVEFLHRRDS